MESLPLSSPIEAENRRSLELQTLSYSRDGLTLAVAEDPSGRRWLIRFDDVAVGLVRGWDLSGPTLAKLTGDGALFQIRGDDAFYEAHGAQRFKTRYNHFVISCYDDVVEVLAAKVSFEMTA